MKLERARHWIFLIGQFLAGQGFINALSLLTGILIIRLLPMSEYAIYVIFALLFSLGTAGSDLGLGKALITFGAKESGDREALGRLYGLTLHYKRLLFILASLILAVLAYFMTQALDCSSRYIGVCFLAAILTNWIQQSVGLRRVVLNIHHDASGLWKVGLAHIVFRISLIIMLCAIWPSAIMALCANFIAMLVLNELLGRVCDKYMHDSGTIDQERSAEFRAFVLPIVPVTIYGRLKSHLSLALLGLFGCVNAVAEFGALSRLALVCSLLAKVNPFFIQPYFAKIRERKEFFFKGALALLLVSTGGLLIWISAVCCPQYWLAIIGSDYATLSAVLPLAISVNLILLLDGMLFSLLLSRAETRGQYLHIPLGIGLQILYLSLFGIQNSADAFLMNNLVVAGGMALQTVFLARAFWQWKKPSWTGDAGRVKT